MNVLAYPARTSAKAALLAALLRGESVTSLDAWKRFSTSRAAGLVEQLRRAGFPILTRTIAVRTADAGRVAHVAEYVMPPEMVKSAGQAGQAFVAQVDAARGR